MTRIFAIIFTGLTLGAASMTYYDVGMQDTKVTTVERSVRSGSHGGVFYGGGGNGGYRTGK